MVKQILIVKLFLVSFVVLLVVGLQAASLVILIGSVPIFVLTCLETARDEAKKAIGNVVSRTLAERPVTVTVRVEEDGYHNGYRTRWH